MLITLRLRVQCGSRKKQWFLPYTSLRDSFFITEAERFYCAVRTESLYNTDKIGP